MAKQIQINRVAQSGPPAYEDPPLVIEAPSAQLLAAAERAGELIAAIEARLEPAEPAEN